MMGTIKAEARKLLSTRSTYFIVLACLLITTFFAGFIEGFRGEPKALQVPGLLSGESTSAIVFVGFILAFAGLLLAGHEYRYNTIYYTLTSANRRYKILLAKFFVITIFTAVVALVVTFVSPLCTIVGVHLAGKHIGPQIFDVWSIVWHCLLTSWAYSMYAFILIMLIRNQVGAIVTFLLLPLIGENILMLLLKHNGKYLPFTAAQSIVSPTTMGNHTTSTQAALTALTYIIIGLALSTILFVRRDAN
jgi:ABC-type transport system involved in multi-copper enzyme maturation permease subunit